VARELGGPEDPGKATATGRTHQAPRRRRRLVIGCGAVALALLAGTLGGACALLASYDRGVQRMSAVFPPEAGRPAPSPEGENWLLVVSDPRAGADVAATDAATDTAPSPHDSGAWRADSIMLVHLPDAGAHLKVISLPPGSWVPVPGSGFARIDSALATGGPRSLVESVEQLMLVRVDHFAILDMPALRAAVDTLGGVDVRGRHMDGRAVLRYVRKGRICLRECGPQAKIVRQRALLGAVRAALTDSALLFDPLRLHRAILSVAGSLRVDDSVELRELAGALVRARSGTVVLRPAPGRTASREGEPVILLDVLRTRELWHTEPEGRAAA
jgi:LCP family protein required for cell wall assembly